MAPSWRGETTVTASATFPRLTPVLWRLGGVYHSLGLRADGSIVAWGNNGSGQCNVPAPNSGFAAIDGGGDHSLGLKADGSIVAWGSNGLGQCSVPAPNTGFVAVAGGWQH